MQAGETYHAVALESRYRTANSIRCYDCAASGIAKPRERNRTTQHQQVWNPIRRQVGHLDCYDVGNGSERNGRAEKRPGRDIAQPNHRIGRRECGDAVKGAIIIDVACPDAPHGADIQRERLQRREHGPTATKILKKVQSVEAADEHVNKAVRTLGVGTLERLGRNAGADEKHKGGECTVSQVPVPTDRIVIGRAQHYIEPAIA